MPTASHSVSVGCALNYETEVCAKGWLTTSGPDAILAPVELYIATGVQSWRSERRKVSEHEACEDLIEISHQGG